MAQMNQKCPLTQEAINAGFANVVLNGTKEEIAFYADFVSDPNVPDVRYGRLPIWVAIEGEDAYEKTKIVLSLNPDVNVKNENGQTPVMVALEKRMQSIGVLFLRHPQLDITAVDRDGNDLMKYAVLSRSPKVVTEAAKRGIALDKTDRKGHLPAYYCVQNEDIDVFRALCLNGFKPDKNNPAYQEIIQLAFEYARAEQSLSWIRAVYRGVFCDIKQCILVQDWDTLKRRVDRLSDANQFRIGKMLGIDFSRHNVHIPPHFEKTTEQALSDVLIEQCRYGNAMDVSLLLSVGANPNLRDKMGRTPLFCAISCRHKADKKQTPASVAEDAYRKVKVLLENGANPNLPNLIKRNHQDVADTTPLEQSFLENRIGISGLLIKSGADITSAVHNIPLIHIASAYSKSVGIDILARAGADLSAPDKDGIFPIQYAIINDKPYNVAMLRKHLTAQGKTEFFDITTKQGQALYQMAVQKGDMMCDAFNGLLIDAVQSKANDFQSHRSFSEKVKALSPQKLRLLAILGGIELHLENDNNSQISMNAGVEKALYRHTPFRQALAIFKRNQRKKR